MKKAADDIDKHRYKKAFESLEKIEKIEEKIKNPVISYHLLFFKGFAKYKVDELEEALALLGKALELSWELFSKEPERRDYRSFVRDTIGSIGELLWALEDPDEAKEYISSMKGIFEKAVLGFEKLLESDPKNTDYLEVFLGTIEHLGLCFEAGELIEDAVQLFDKRFDLIEKLLESENEISDHLSSLYDSLLNFGEICEEEGYFEERYIEEAKRVYDRAIEIYGKVLDKYPEDSDTKVNLSYIYLNLAEIYADQENLVKAEECYKEVFGLLKSEIEKEPEDISVSENIEVSENTSVPNKFLFSMVLADVYKTAGTIFLDSEDTTKARYYYTKAKITFRELLDKCPDFPGADKSLARYLDELAELFLEIGDLENAEICYKDEEHIYKNLLQKDPENPENNEYSLDISDIYRKLGDIFAEAEEIEKARAYFDKEIEIYESLHSKEADKLMLEAYKADTWNHIGWLYTEEEPETAVRYHERALSVFQEAFESKPWKVFIHEGLLETLISLGILFKKSKELEKAIQMYEKVVKVQKKLLELMSTESRHEKAHDYDLIHCHDHKHDIDHDHVMDLFYELKHSHDLDIETTYYELGVLHSEIGDEEKSSAYHRLALERFEEITAEWSENPKLLMLASGRAFVLGVVLLKKLEFENKDSSIARKYYEFALRTIEQLYEANPTNLKLQEMLAKFAGQIGEVYKNADKLEETIKEYEYAYRSLKILYENDPENPKHIHNILGALNNLGIGYLVTDQQEKAKEYFDKALALNKSLEKSDPEDLDILKSNFMLFNNYANLLEKMGDIETSKEYRKKANETNAKLGEEDPCWYTSFDLLGS
ncbi:MAG: DUF2225 domain-containing protein [Euryarchaeota archaeon]|nr:DUF2225 domain-containing protein [Euryarchaeota archaeon]